MNGLRLIEAAALALLWRRWFYDAPYEGVYLKRGNVRAWGMTRRECARNMRDAERRIRRRLRRRALP